MAELALATKYGQIQSERSSIELAPELIELQEKLKKDRHNPQLWFDLGQAYKAQNLCREAVESMSMCLSLNPFNAQAYRYKGHYNINIGRFEEAAADLTLASRLDPSDWSIWYHLGLSFYLLADYTRADTAFSECLRLAKTFEYVVDSVNWLWMLRMQMGQTARAKEVIALVPPNTPCESHEYYNRCMVFGGHVDPEEMLAHARTLSDHLYVTEGYGIACYYEVTGNIPRADEIFDELEQHCDEMWSGFAAHAVRVRQARRRAGA